MIRITSSRDPFRNPRLAGKAASVLGRAEAMGLLPPEDSIDTLDLPALRKVIKHVHKAGIGKAIQVANVEPAIREVEHVLDRLITALEESPAPEYEWRRLADVLGIDLLSRLLGIAAVSIRRYSAGVRVTPDALAGRLHLLSLIVGDLSGAYNDIGVRQWFDRKRTQLGGKTPAELLRGRWEAKDRGPGQVRELARSLTATPAT
jgi:hypothetical protein